MESVRVQSRKNLHVPLPEPVYRALREEAAALKRPATALHSPGTA